VNAERHTRTRIAEAVERGERNQDVVPDATDVDDQAAGMFFDKRACETGDHGR
jgi:hypothetical protein